MNNIVVTSELSDQVELLVNSILFQYGIIISVLIIVILYIGWKWLDNKISGEVTKGVNAHKAEIDNTYAVKIENYRNFVVKQHEVYSHLNKLLLEADGLIAYQAFKSYPDFQSYSEKDLREYLNDKLPTEPELDRLIKLMNEPRELQEQMQNYINRYNLKMARKIWHDAKNYYWFNALYFSDNVKDSFFAISKKLGEILVIQEYPTGDSGNLSKEDHKTLRSTQEDLRSDIEELIKLMREELSSGYISKQKK